MNITPLLENATLSSPQKLHVRLSQKYILNSTAADKSWLL